LQYLTDKALPTKQEIAAVYKLHADIQPCRKIVLEGAAKTSAGHGAVLIGSFSASDKLWVEFASGHMTWGKFNSERQSIIQQSAQQQAEVNTRIASQLQNQHQVEIEQRQRAAAAMQQWAYQQQVLENQRQAITAQRDAAATANKINCTFFSNMMSCQ
jgi:hypothetical protein